MNRTHVKKIVFAALSCALVFVATMISVPTPVVGNVNLGDAAILLTAWILGGPWSVVASACGSTLADLVSGYALYAPATLLIKGGLALCALGLEKGLRRLRLPPMVCLLLSGLCAEVWMAGGYFVYEATVLSLGWAAAANLPFNAVQGGVGLGLGILAARLLRTLQQKQK